MVQFSPNLKVNGIRAKLSPKLETQEHDAPRLEPWMLPLRKTNLSSLCLCVLSGPLTDWMLKPIIGEASLFSQLMQMLVFSRDRGIH